MEKWLAECDDARLGPLSAFYEFDRMLGLNVRFLASKEFGGLGVGIL